MRPHLVRLVVVRELRVFFLPEPFHVRQEVLGVRRLVELALGGEVPPHVHLGRRRGRRRLLGVAGCGEGGGAKGGELRTGRVTGAQQCV